VNNTIYGETGLTSTNFWNYYGGDDNYYVVEISTWKGGKKVVLESNKAVATDKAYTTKADGIIVTTLLNDGETQTSNISVDVNELVKSQNTYDNKNGKGAEYTVTVTIPSDDKKVLGDIVLTQVFYVKETCTAYKFNNLYYAGTVDNYADVVVTKGRVNATTNKWDLSMQISEVFEMITNKAGVKENIFEYFDDVNNAKAIAFSLEPSTQKGVAYDATNNVISLNAPLSTPTLFAGMKYVVTLDNGETCTFKFNVEFINPFIAGTAKAVSLNGNAIGAVTAETAPSVVVVEAATPANQIFAWNATTKALGLVAANADKYKVAAPTVEYAFVENDAYKAFAGQLDAKSTFEVDPATGVVTFDNQGAQLQNAHNLTVKATVTFADLSVVTVNIPLTIATK
ncbi:MAG: hypothetical protein K2L69_00050, partial [Muribaculaceae bacterium]|nr:hypothetical protein [Muribaculaceae bacterium]